MDHVPTVPKVLLDYLERTFPDKLPGGIVSADHLAELIGQQGVIRHLRAAYKHQNKETS